MCISYKERQWMRYSYTRRTIQQIRNPTHALFTARPPPLLPLQRNGNICVCMCVFIPSHCTRDTFPELLFCPL